MTDPWQLTDEELAALNCDCNPSWSVHRDTCFVPVVGSIKASAYRAGQVDALTDAADNVSKDWFEDRLEELTTPDIRLWLRARAAEVGDDRSGE